MDLPNIVFVSTHARHATGDSGIEITRCISIVSTHARHATGDPLQHGGVHERIVSTHARHATGDWANAPAFIMSCIVSTHARHATGDERKRNNESIHLCFNSRPSCDGRPNGVVGLLLLMKFQLTPVMRRATHF